MLAVLIFVVDISGFEDYGITEDGRVYSFRLKRFISSNISKGYLIVSLNKGDRYYSRGVHRLIAEAYIPNPHNLPQVDHIDRNKLNNEISNLRWCSQQQNMLNTGKNQETQQTSSKHKGVSFDKVRETWRVMSTLGGRRIFLGRFTTEEEAVEAYNDFVLNNHGEYANPNVVE